MRLLVLGRAAAAAAAGALALGMASRPDPHHAGVFALRGHMASPALSGTAAGPATPAP